MTNRNDTLQAMCRGYLKRVRHMARRCGIDVDSFILANKRRECVATEKEVAALARLCDDERVERTSIPKILGKSYRQCFDDDDFGGIKKLRRVGIYSKVSALLYADKIKSAKKQIKVNLFVNIKGS